ncbi:cryptochrome/photolyase family protein [Phaeovulum vinaykumarii]|uniref:Deoxyribodipyrimidine photo-lyase n=1 Tax=Phaeovulum vinaykumarii TaxID=407234 RepID=A0A1N7L7S4_9RHOB|nr:deoxyribodipyrimidine photo-lyase [Phaeovulum vinaykumarii]SIS69888.1 deoxyribodipyrimidine photo-lyase [Phaeovulum vinaykumarii]SOB99256.1 deoxyribodipyrimidine photo-lyase [Phaeovulum vinaykumarii]
MTAPALWWLRRDLRLAENPALAAARASGRPVIAVFVHDESVAALGAAAKWRLGQGLEVLAQALAARGGRLILRRGPAGAALAALAAETGAAELHWNRLYDRASRARDSAVKAELRAAGLRVESHAGHVIFEPMSVETGQGGPYRVYSPFWRAVKDRPVAAPEPAPAHWPAPEAWPVSDRLADWAMGAAMRRGAEVLARHAVVGEAAARDRLAAFITHRIDGYRALRDFPAEPATSGLSENLAWGEIGPRTIWHAGQAALAQGARGAEHFLKELVWREFAWHLLYHFPDMDHQNWRPEWDEFDWKPDNDAAEAWRRGLTGEPFVDAAMRQMYVTGTMHNRARMIAASYLTKHLLTDWRVGLAWFADCLTDWDPAANAMGWQWVAGCGPDAAPYFRIFNPATQATKFDPHGRYRRAWIAEGQPAPPDTARAYFDAVPRAWNLSPDRPYPRPLVALDEGRRRALAAYEHLPRKK